MVPVTRRVLDMIHPRIRQFDALNRSFAAAGSAHLAARRALALAVAEEEREARRRDALTDRAADLEERAMAAIVAGREDLARRAAEAIAALETEVAASEAAATRFSVRVSAARRAVELQRGRLAELDRGRRLARLGQVLDAPWLVSDDVPAIDRAEAALAALEDAQAANAAVGDAPAGDRGRGAAALADEMAEAGFGRPTRTLAVDVLARLRLRAASPKLAHAAALRA